MSMFNLNKKKSSSSTSSSSSNSSYASNNSNYGSCKHSNNFVKFDEKKDYVKRCHRKCSNEKKSPLAVSFCLSK